MVTLRENLGFNGNAGSLVMKLQETEYNFKSVLYGVICGNEFYGNVAQGVHGSIGVVASIPQELFTFLQQVQINANKVIRGVGGFSHEQ